MSIPSPLSPLRQRFWQAGLALALFIASIVIANTFVAADRSLSRTSTGHDFLAFYTAGTFVRTGRGAEMYDLPAVKSFERQIAAREGLELSPESFGPYWNPPFFAALFAPLSALPYQTAWFVWLTINLVAFAAAATILCIFVTRTARPCGSETNWHTWALVPLLIATSFPFIQSLAHGQNTCISLMLLTITVALWRSNQPLAAGIVAGLLFYKPQLAAVIAAAMVLTLGRRALAGLAITGVTLLLITMLALPGTLAAFLHKLPQNIAYMQIEHPYLWERHVTLKAFWRLLLQGHATGELITIARIGWLAASFSLAACLMIMLWRHRRDATPQTRDRLIAATIAAMPLLMPFYFDYDLLLLSVPAVLYACDRLSRQQMMPADRRIVWAWIALFVWLFVNSAAARQTHVNVTVLLLSCVAATLIRQAWRRVQQQTTTAESQVLRRAA